MTRIDHEQAFVSVFVLPEKRARYAEFLPKPKRRVEITNRFCHCFDLIPTFAKQIPRGGASELAALLRARGAVATAHVIGGRDEIDGQDLPLEQAIDCALADSSGVVVSCVPGRLALFIQEFPPGDTFILSDAPSRLPIMNCWPRCIAPRLAWRNTRRPPREVPFDANRLP